MFAALLGAIFANWLDQPDSIVKSEVLYWTTSRPLPEEFCQPYNSSEYSIRRCSVVAIDIKNPNYVDLPGFSVIVDFKGMYREFAEPDQFSVAESPDFLSTDVKVSKTTGYQRKITFDKFPKLGSVKILAIVGTDLIFEPKIESSGAVELVNAVDKVQTEGWEKYFFAVVLGFLIIPALGLVVAFFQWLSRDISEQSASRPSESDTPND